MIIKIKKFRLMRGHRIDVCRLVRRQNFVIIKGQLVDSLVSVLYCRYRQKLTFIRLL
jgi:hypothetical protein